MEEPIHPVPTDEETPQQTLGRRQLLKALGATGGAVAASSLLPGKWARPVIEAGVLPAHAQVTPTPQPTESPTEVPTAVPLEYSAVCDSTPGGGDLTAFDNIIQQIQPYIVIVSGSGPLENITATMTATAVTGPLPIFNPPLPQTATTNASGQAVFGTLQVSPTSQTGQSFLLVFDFSVPSGTARVECGVFFFPELPM